MSIFTGITIVNVLFLLTIVTLLAESLRSFLDESGKRKRLCRHLQVPLICRSSSDLDESDKFHTDKPVIPVHERIFWSFADSFCAHAP